MAELLIFGGAIDGGLKERDYPMGDLLVAPKYPQYTWADSRYEDRQGTSECVIFGIMGCIVDNTKQTFSDFDKGILRHMLPTYDWDVVNGMYTTDGGDLLVDFFKLNNRTLVKAPVRTYDDESKEFLQRLEDGWTLTFGSQISKQYIDDIQADGDIDYLLGGNTGHLRRIFKHRTNGNYYIVENFKNSLKYNVIEITPAKLKEQLDNKKLHYTSFYFYFLDNPMTIPVHKTGNTAEEKQIVVAWELIVQQGFKPAFEKYDDTFYITKMLSDIAMARKGIK